MRAYFPFTGKRVRQRQGLGGGASLAPVPGLRGIGTGKQAVEQITPVSANEIAGDAGVWEPVGGHPSRSFVQHPNRLSRARILDLDAVVPPFAAQIAPPLVRMQEITLERGPVAAVNRTPVVLGHRQRHGILRWHHRIERLVGETRPEVGIPYDPVHHLPRPIQPFHVSPGALQVLAIVDPHPTLPLAAADHLVVEPRGTRVPVRFVIRQRFAEMHMLVQRPQRRFILDDLTLHRHSDHVRASIVLFPENSDREGVYVPGDAFRME